MSDRILDWHDFFFADYIDLVVEPFDGDEAEQIVAILGDIHTGTLQAKIMCQRSPKYADRYTKQHNAAVRRYAAQARRLHAVMAGDYSRWCIQCHRVFTHPHWRYFPAVVSYYDHPLVRQLYPESHWDIHTVPAVKNSNNRFGYKTKVSELLICRKSAS